MHFHEAQHCIEIRSSDFFILTHEEKPSTSSYYLYFQIILDFGLKIFLTLDIPLSLKLQDMCNNPKPFKIKMVVKAKMVDHCQLRTC